jgi:phage FluMu protein Com
MGRKSFTASRLEEIRCPDCDKLLGKVRIVLGAIEIKCPRCNIKYNKEFNTLRTVSPNTAPRDGHAGEHHDSAFSH